MIWLLLLFTQADGQSHPHAVPQMPRASQSVVPVQTQSKLTAEELTHPVVHYDCDLISFDGRRGRFAFSVLGGRAYSNEIGQSAVVPDIGRTEQIVKFGQDELGLFASPRSTEVDLTTGTGRFFVQEDAMAAPLPYGAPKQKSVTVQFNYGMRSTIAVHTVPKADIARGFCTHRAETQQPLSPEEARKVLSR